MTDRALAAKEFGFSGSLERGIEECATNSDNIQAFRCGAKPMVLKGVGLDTTAGTTTAGFDITFSDVTADAGTRYQIWYSAGVLSVWKDGTLEYSNVVNASVDTATTDMTRCLCSAAQKTPRARGRTRPDPAGPGCAATSRNATILPHFQLDRNIPSRAKRHGKAGELPCFSGRQEFSGDFPLRVGSASSSRNVTIPLLLHFHSDRGILLRAKLRQEDGKSSYFSRIEDFSRKMEG